jgi:uncharacterized protein
MVEEISIPCGDTFLSASHYSSPQSRACIVLAHGFGLIRSAGLAPYAELFRDAGYHVLVFDYRHFGKSGGDPRQVLDVRKQLEDWCAAVKFARTLPGVDPQQIGLWGTSFSGGHVVVTAARDTKVAAVIAQTPFMDGMAMVSVLGLSGMVRLTLPIMRDVARQFTGRQPYYVSIAGLPGQIAALPVKEAAEGYAMLLGSELRDRGMIAARALLLLPLYRPLRYASKVRCPLLIQVADHDTVTPMHAARRAANRAPLGIVQTFSAGHFDFYSGPTFRAATERQLAFLKEHLAPP